MVELNNVTVVRSGRTLLENFSLKITQHEHLVIQGPSGSGKTTLLELIAGIVHPAIGEIKYDFISAVDWQDRYHQLRENIRYIPSRTLQTFLNGHHHLFYQQRYYNMGDEQIPKVRDFLGDHVQELTAFGFPDTFNIESLLDLELTRLSNGQLKKVLILNNLAGRLPKFILFDYPFEGLDQQSRRELIEFIDHIAITFSIQIIITDHHHELPKVINRKLVIRNFQADKIEKVTLLSPTPVIRPAIINTPKTATHGSPVVEMKDLTIQYGSKKIIQNFNWIINKGERWALTGKNGSGKTTLFSLIYADHPMAYSQKVFLFGKRRGSGESIWDIKRRINYLGPEQIHFLNPESFMISARRYILDQKPKQEERLAALIDFFQAGSFIDHPVRWLSSGQLQMMLLMQAFIKNRELVLLDEPFQFLDPASKLKIVEYLNQYLDSDTTLVLITHYDDDLLSWTQKRKSL